eukprot:scaffold54464_cov46-Attheya_sp.AAC.3
MGSNSHSRDEGNSEKLFAGHVIHVNCPKYRERDQLMIMVKIQPPMNPSHVLLGLRLIKGRCMNFLPQVRPEK